MCFYMNFNLEALDSATRNYGVRDDKLRNKSVLYFKGLEVYTYEKIKTLLEDDPTYEDCIHGITIRADFIRYIENPSDDVISYYRFLYVL